MDKLVLNQSIVNKCNKIIDQLLNDSKYSYLKYFDIFIDKDVNKTVFDSDNFLISAIVRFRETLRYLSTDFVFTKNYFPNDFADFILNISLLLSCLDSLSKVTKIKTSCEINNMAIFTKCKKYAPNYSKSSNLEYFKFIRAMFVHPVEYSNRFKKDIKQMPLFVDVSWNSNQLKKLFKKNFDLSYTVSYLSKNPKIGYIYLDEFVLFANSIIVSFTNLLIKLRDDIELKQKTKAKKSEIGFKMKNFNNPVNVLILRKKILKNKYFRNEDLSDWIGNQLLICVDILNNKNKLDKNFTDYIVKRLKKLCKTINQNIFSIHNGFIFNELNVRPLFKSIDTQNALYDSSKFGDLNKWVLRLLDYKYNKKIEAITDNDASLIRFHYFIDTLNLPCFEICFGKIFKKHFEKTNFENDLLLYELILQEIFFKLKF